MRGARWVRECGGIGGSTADHHLPPTHKDTRQRLKSVFGEVRLAGTTVSRLGGKKSGGGGKTASLAHDGTFAEPGD